MTFVRYTHLPISIVLGLTHTIPQITKSLNASTREPTPGLSHNKLTAEFADVMKISFSFLSPTSYQLVVCIRKPLSPLLG